MWREGLGHSPCGGIHLLGDGFALRWRAIRVVLWEFWGGLVSVDHFSIPNYPCEVVMWRLLTLYVCGVCVCVPINPVVMWLCLDASAVC